MVIAQYFCPSGDRKISGALSVIDVGANHARASSYNHRLELGIALKIYLFK